MKPPAQPLSKVRPWKLQHKIIKMQRKTRLALGEYYHIYNRGNNKSIIFKNNSDKDRFMDLLFLCNSREPVVMKEINDSFYKSNRVFLHKRGEVIVAIGLYKLMDNHFHISIKEITEGGISLFMKKLSTAYSMYFNKKYDRTGKLFEGVFRSKHVNNDNHLKYLFSYIHLNIVEKLEPNWKEDGIKDMERVKKFLHNYKYSSYLDYMGADRVEKNILTKEEFPEYFSDPKEITE